MVAHCAWLLDVIISASDSLGLDSRSIVELFRAAEPRVQESTASSEPSETTSSMPVVRGTD